MKVGIVISDRYFRLSQSFLYLGMYRLPDITDWLLWIKYVWSFCPSCYLMAANGPNVSCGTYLFSVHTYRGGIEARLCSRVALVRSLRVVGLFTFIRIMHSL